MIKEEMQLIAGKLTWNWIKCINKLDASKVILVLAGENEKVDFYALKYLDRAIERKMADEALIFACTDESYRQASNYKDFQYPVNIKKISEKQLELIYRYYCLYKFNKNLFFTFTDRTKDNLLGRFIRETEIDEKDTVCLAIYNFRTVYGEE